MNAPTLKNWFQINRAGLEPVIVAFDPTDRASVRDAFDRATATRARLIRRGVIVSVVYVAKAGSPWLAFVPCLDEADDAAAVDVNDPHRPPSAPAWVIRRNSNRGHRSFRFESKAQALKHFEAFAASLRPGEWLTLCDPYDREIARDNGLREQA